MEDQRHAFIADVPDLSAFAWPDDLKQAAADDVGPPKSRIQVAKVGAFKHPRYGAFKVTRDTFDSFRANLAANLVGDRLPMDFDHEPDYGGKSAACGWITALEADGDALMADVEWTWDGAYAIRSGAYRWISPTWQLTYTDDAGEKHGPTMLAAALTNRPFFTRMAAVSLSESFSRAFAGMPDQTTEEQGSTATAPSVRFDRIFTVAAARLDRDRRAFVESLYARDPQHGMHVLETLLKPAG